MAVQNPPSTRPGARLAFAILGGLTLMLGAIFFSPSQADAQAHDGDGGGGAYTAICIDNPIVLEHPRADSLGLSAEFDNKGDFYQIITGPPTCSFTGKGCDRSLNLWLVKDVKTCVAALAAASEAAAAVDSIPATVDAASATVAVPISAGTTGLAVTGAETSVLAYAGAAMLGFGALAMGTARGRRRIRS